MFRLAHLSDVHLGPLPEISYRELASKRITGYINWQRNRRAKLHDRVIDLLLTDMHGQKPDHIAVTGDLMNLALREEIEMSRLWLQEVGSGADVSVVPGNHDAYVPGALEKACKAWGEWMWGDGDVHPTGKGEFPYLRRRGNCAIIGVSSARATAPFMASGYFGSTQAKRLGALLDKTRKEGLFRVILIHHPPVRGAAKSHKRLFGIGRFQKVLDRHGAELVLHGHTHLPTLYRLSGHDGPVPVVGVAAAGQTPGAPEPASQYNLFQIDGRAGAWQATLQRFGINGKGNAFGRVDEVDLFGRDLARVGS